MRLFLKIMKSRKSNKNNFNRMVNPDFVNPNFYRVLTNYAQFLLDLEFKIKDGLTIIRPYSIEYKKGIDNDPIKKRDALLSFPYNQAKLDDYLIVSHTIALLEENEDPTRIILRKVVEAPILDSESKVLYFKVIERYFEKTEVSKKYPYILNLNIKVLNYLRKVAREYIGKDELSEIRFELENDYIRQDLIENLYEKIPYQFTYLDKKILLMLGDFIKFLKTSKPYYYNDRSLNRSKRYKKEPIQFLGSYFDFIKLIDNNKTLKSKEVFIISNYFKTKKKFVYKTYNYENSEKELTVYKRFSRDIKKYLVGRKLKIEDVNYIFNELGLWIDFNNYRKIK